MPRNLFGEYSENSPRAPPHWVLESPFFCSLGLLEVGIGNGEKHFLLLRCQVTVWPPLS